MAKNTLRVIVRIKARPDKVNELLSVLSSLVEPTHNEVGCLSYELLQHNEDITDLALIEEWQDEKALELHIATKHFKDAMIKLPKLVAVEPDIRKYHQVR